MIYLNPLVAETKDTSSGVPVYIPVMSCVIMELKVLDEISATEGFGVLRSDAMLLATGGPQ